MYTLRDLDADIVLMHGPAGCGFMAARRLEEAGVKVMTTGMTEDDLIFGGKDKLIRILRKIDDDFHPKLMGVVGTCASMIIGENLDDAIKSAGIRSVVLPVDIHGCSGANTNGAVRTLEVAAEKGVISVDECERQKRMLHQATLIEMEKGLTSREYLEPSAGATKLSAALRTAEVLRSGGKVAVVLNAKKETAYGFADIMRAVESSRRKLGGETIYIANLDPKVGLPRIRKYAENINSDLLEAGVDIGTITGGLDEYPVSGEKAANALDMNEVDLRIIAGVPHAVPRLIKDDILVTDQPRQLRNYIDNGFKMAIGEISTHADVMGTSRVLTTEFGDTLREVTEKGYN